MRSLELLDLLVRDLDSDLTSSSPKTLYMLKVVMMMTTTMTPTSSSQVQVLSLNERLPYTTYHLKLKGRPTGHKFYIVNLRYLIDIHYRES